MVLGYWHLGCIMFYWGRNCPMHQTLARSVLDLEMPVENVPACPSEVSRTLWVKPLPCKHGDQKYDSSEHRYKSKVWCHRLLIPALGTWSLITGLQAKERPCLKRRLGPLLKNKTQGRLWSLHTHVHTHAQVPVHRGAHK